MADKEWWETDVPRVLSEMETFYGRLVEKYPDRTKLAFTKEKVIAAREWEPTRSMYEKHFEQVLKQLGFAYIPNRILPGPAFIFPIKGADGKYTCAQTKPLEGSKLHGKSKYRYIGEDPLGPRWLGLDHATLKTIIEKRIAIVVEGPFDLLAARLLCPTAPIISPLTKVLGKNHQAYLRVLGVRHVYLLYDNDDAGKTSMAQQKANIKTMAVSMLSCPRSDPSEVLKNTYDAAKLKTMLYPFSSIKEHGRIAQPA